MALISFGEIRKELDDAITYADFDRARVLVQEGIALAHVEEAVSELMYFRAQKDILDGKLESAMRWLDLAIQYNPLDGAAYNDRALCVIDSGGDSHSALVDFNKGIAAEPDYATIYHNKGWYLNRLGRHEEAIAYFEKTLALEPGRAVTYENLADAYWNLGRKDKALWAFKLALEHLRPSYDWIREQLESRVRDCLGDNG